MNAFWNLILDNNDVAGQIEELNGKIHELVAFFLILYEMGLEDRDVHRIMGITQEAIRIPE